MFLAEVVFVFDDYIFVVAYGLFTLDVYAAVGFEFQRNFLDQFYYFEDIFSDVKSRAWIISIPLHVLT